MNQKQNTSTQADKPAGQLKLTAEEFRVLASQLSKVYDLVRAVDVCKQEVVSFGDDSSREVEREYHCFEIWKKDRRCDNCISSMAFRQRERLSKFEFVDHDIFHITSQYVEIDGQPYVLEIVQKDSDEALTGAFGKNETVNTIKKYSEMVYTDSVTQIHNRRYFDDQLAELDMDAVAMIDVDNFKEVNDTYGHICGDEALKAVAQTIRQAVRNVDSVIRYGGDEFLVAFSIMESACFQERMEVVRQAVERISLPDYPDMQLSISIGGAAGRRKCRDLIVLADKEMYRAKQQKNRVHVGVF